MNPPVLAYQIAPPAVTNFTNDINTATNGSSVVESEQEGQSSQQQRNKRPRMEEDLIRLSDITPAVEPFFLDYSFFVDSLEGIYRILDLTPPGPSAEMDLYQLYCLHIQGDTHVLRLIKGLCQISRKCNEIKGQLALAKRKSPEVGQKSKQKLREFYSSNNILAALENPFVIPEFGFRMNLQNIWSRESKLGCVTKKQKIKIYIQYCLHMLQLQDFFESVFMLTLVLPHGPYNVLFMEQTLIMFKTTPDAPNLSGPDATTLAFYIRQDVGMDHEFFQMLPPVLQFLTGNETVKIMFPKISRASSSSGHESVELCATSPSACGSEDRVQLQYPSELLNPNFKEVFSWVFIATQDPAVFMIRNEQWNDYLTVDKSPAEKSGTFNLLTTLNVKESRARFTLNVQGHCVRIISVVTATPLTVDQRKCEVFVPSKVTSKACDPESSVFLIKKVS